VVALGTGGASAAVTTLVIPSTVTTGARFLLARADALDQIAEGDESNNTTAVPIEIGNFADLQIAAVAGPVAVGTGRPMTVSFTTRNAGLAPVGPFRVNLFLAAAPNPAPTPGNGIGVGFKDLPGLGAGASLASTLIANLPASFAAGSFFLSAAADAGNAGVALGGKPILSLGPLASLATTASLIVPANLAPGFYLLSAVADADNTIPELGGNDGLAVNGRVVTKATTVHLSP
jgi:hypothetical protein